MKNFSFLLLTLFAVTFSINANAQYSESMLQSYFMDLLEDNGYEGWVDSDGDVQFSYNDHDYFIEVNESDNEFFRVVLFNIWPIESLEEYNDVLGAVNEVNKEQKVAKAYITNDNVWIAAELFVGDPSHVENIFMRCLEVIEESVDVFIEEM